ncbi:glycoside hydrolase superfamily [Tribonema minus]|uniref:Glycoside hydrolase superfamily n=1 Tax=Tribonema minus TaxID=303371 RepID=A0A836CJS0_9STRA|nr:glycoside hydrolase superfamily [Tribonema minus]
MAAGAAVTADAAITIDGAAQGDPGCAGGTASRSGAVCCPTELCGGACGGTGCEALPGGVENCCATGVLVLSRPCSSHGAPCALRAARRLQKSAQPTPTPTPQPVTQPVSSAQPTAPPTRVPTGKPSAAAAAATHTPTQAPTTRRPTTRQPTTRQPTTRKPTARPSAATARPTTLRPTTSRPTTRQPTSKPVLGGGTVGTLGSVRRATTIAVLPGPPTPNLFQREASYKMTVDALTYFMKVPDLLQRPDTFYNPVKDALSRGRKVQVVLEFVGTSGLRQINDGAYDEHLKALARTAKADGRQIYLRPLHEFNGDWYDWGVYNAKNNGDIQMFKNAFRRVVNTLRSNGAPFKYQIGYNVGNGQGKPTPLSDFYVGDSYVDQICVTAYNRAGLDGNEVSRSYYDILSDAYDKLTHLPAGVSSNTKELCVGELGTTAYNTNKPRWIAETWDTLATKFTRVTTITWFLENKGAANWDLNTPPEIDAWVAGYKRFKETTKP